MKLYAKSWRDKWSIYLFAFRIIWYRSTRGLYVEVNLFSRWFILGVEP